MVEQFHILKRYQFKSGLCHQILLTSRLIICFGDQVRGDRQGLVSARSFLLKRTRALFGVVFPSVALLENWFYQNLVGSFHRLCEGKRKPVVSCGKRLGHQKLSVVMNKQVASVREKNYKTNPKIRVLLTRSTGALQKRGTNFVNIAQ